MSKKANDQVEEVQDEASIAEAALVEVIADAFKVAVESELDEDETKLSMIQAGATFKNVTRLFNTLMIENGFAISKEERDEIVADVLTGSDLSTEEGFDSASAELVSRVKGATERSAAALIRAHGKKNEVEVYAKPKVSAAPRNPFVTSFHSALIENPSMTEEELRELIAGLDEAHQTNPLRWFSQHNNIRKTVNSVVERMAA